MPRGRLLFRLRGASFGRGANDIEGEDVDGVVQPEARVSARVRVREEEVLLLLLLQGVAKPMSAEASELEHDPLFASGDMRSKSFSELAREFVRSERVSTESTRISRRRDGVGVFRRMLLG